MEEGGEAYAAGQAESGGEGEAGGGGRRGCSARADDPHCRRVHVRVRVTAQGVGPGLSLSLRPKPRLRLRLRPRLRLRLRLRPRPRQGPGLRPRAAGGAGLVNRSGVCWCVCVWSEWADAGAVAPRTHLQQVVVVLQHAVSLARVGEDPGGRLILVERRARGSGGELLKEGSHRASVRAACLWGALSTGRAGSVPRASPQRTGIRPRCSPAAALCSTTLVV